MNLQNNQIDLQIQELLEREYQRQASSICLIASENIASKQVMRAQSNYFMNKYAEGTVGRRFYQGCEIADELEKVCQDRLCKLFGTKFANVQPHSGAQANMAAFYAVLEPKDRLLGMDLASGGHLTHGFARNFSGKFYHAKQYSVDPQTYQIDYDKLYSLAWEYAPKLIIAGASSYSLNIEWQKMHLIAREVGALLLADIAHIAGLIAAKVIPSPVGYADIITGTTHKTLRGPRGGFILTNDEKLYKLINSALMPGIQGGPLMHTVAAKAVAFQEALTDDFKKYGAQIILNAKAMMSVFKEYEIKIIGDKTENHMFVIDVTKFGLSGKQAAKMLENQGIICNYNAIPFDTKPITETSGVRFGVAAVTTCGFDENDCKQLAYIILLILSKKPVNSSRIDPLINKVRKTYEKHAS